MATITSTEGQSLSERAFTCAIFNCNEPDEIWKSKEPSTRLLSRKTPTSSASREISSTSPRRQTGSAKQLPHPRDCFQSSDSIHSLISSTFMAKLAATQDSAFWSIDFLPLQSADLLSRQSSDMGEASGKAQQNDLALSHSDVFTSRDWMCGYEGDHTDINYALTHEIFQSNASNDSNALNSEIHTDSSKWNYMYSATLLNPIESERSDADTASESKSQKKKTSSKSNQKIRACKKLADTKYPRRRVEPDVKVYVKRKKDDILFGRGARSNHWGGNIKYRETIEELKPTYRACAKHEKTRLSQRLVETFKEEGSRFIELDKDVDKWYLVSDKDARRKAGQALREENTADFRAAKRRKYKK